MISQQATDTRSDLKSVSIALSDISKKQRKILANQEKILVYVRRLPPDSPPIPRRFANDLQATKD
jgi:hypothetical protein